MPELFPMGRAYYDPLTNKVYLASPTGLLEIGDALDLLGFLATLTGVRDEALTIKQDLSDNFGDYADQLEDLSARLAPLEYGGISILTMSVAPTTAEIGATVNPQVSWTLNTDPSAQTLNGVALADQVNDRSKAFAGVTAPDPTQAGAITYALHVEDASAPPGSANEYDRSVQLSWLPRRYWGTSASAALDAAGVLALADSELSGTRAKNFAVDGGADPGKYVYFVYPAYLGDPAGYSINGFGETPVITTVSVTTAAGATLNYKVVRSPNRFAGAANVGVS
ncbi:hypothetical protein [Methylorubrum thiocyanatum]|uniref:hypothetical protein n=1 Tax=Methylorubrum thiocyanatum TaxID=47958 RepID=UPI0035C7F476